jgi:hypothetical protein
MSNSSDLGWCVYEAGSRATACACLRRDVFRRAGCREIRLSGSTRGEWVARKCRPLSYSTEDRVSLWAKLALLADEYSAPRAEALRFAREEARSAVPGTFLDFLGRVQPRTLRLRDHCMRSLLLNAPYWWKDPDKAAELLGRDFQDDSETRETIRAELARHYPTLGLRAVWALCEIWPKSPDLLMNTRQFARNIGRRPIGWCATRPK